MNIKTKDALEIYVDDDKIILRKYEPACMFCGNADETVNFNGRLICRECFDKLKSEFEKI